ncbi:MAG TPA: BlaI/MecI/CopY family transcriptional regulator [Microterricola sp.]
MNTLGVLERSIMNALWDAHDGLSAPELGERLLNAEAESPRKEHATTTLLTVLSRLEAKGFVSRSRSSRPHRYFAVNSREEHTATLMHQVLELAPDRDAALARFVGQVSASEAETLRALLDSRPAG